MNDDFDEKKLENYEKDTSRKTAKIKGKVKGTIMAIISVTGVKLMATFLMIFSAIVLIYTGISWIVELIQADKTPKATLATLDVDNLEELVEIKGNSEDGYYLGYVDGFEEKLSELTKKVIDEHNLKGMTEDTIEKMIRAQLVTQYPNLGGDFTSGDDEDIEGDTIKAELIENWDDIKYIQPIENKNIYVNSTGDEILKSTIMKKEQKTKKQIYEVVEAEGDRVKVKVDVEWSLLNLQGWINKSDIDFYQGEKIKVPTYNDDKYQTRLV